MRKFCIIFAATLILSSCANSYLSPDIQYRNSSKDGSEIKNIKVIWNGYRLLKESGPFNACKYGGGQSFAIKKRSDLFGSVHAEWENAKGEKISKDFIFKKEDLTSNPYHLSTIILFFTQSDIEYYTSDNPNIKEIERRKSGDWTNKWFEKDWEHKCVNDPKETKRKRDLNKKYPTN